MIDLIPDRFKNCFIKSSTGSDIFNIDFFDPIFTFLPSEIIRYEWNIPFVTRNKPPEYPPISIERFGITMYPVKTSEVNNYILNFLPLEPLQAKEKLKSLFPNVPDKVIDNVLPEILDIKRKILTPTTATTATTLGLSVHEKLTSYINSLINAEIQNNRAFVPRAGSEIISYIERFNTPQYQYIPSNIELFERLGYRAKEKIERKQVAPPILPPTGDEHQFSFEFLGEAEKPKIEPVLAKFFVAKQESNKKREFKIYDYEQFTVDVLKRFFPRYEIEGYSESTAASLVSEHMTGLPNIRVKVLRTFVVKPNVDLREPSGSNAFVERDLKGQGWESIKVIEYRLYDASHIIPKKDISVGRLFKLLGVPPSPLLLDLIISPREKFNRIARQIQAEGAYEEAKHTKPLLRTSSLVEELGLSKKPGNFIVFNVRIKVGKDKETIDAVLEDNATFFFREGFLPPEKGLSSYPGKGLSAYIVSEYVEQRLMDFSTERLRKLEKLFEKQIQHELKEYGLKPKIESVQKAAADLVRQFVTRGKVTEYNYYNTKVWRRRK